MMEYAHPAVLVSTDWVAQYCHNPHVRLVEADEDVLLYDTGHIPGAVHVDWRSELQQHVIRDYLDKEAFAQLLGRKGIGNHHTVVFYGDNHNWWACYAFWVFKLYGHEDCRVLNGGRQKWLHEGRPLTRARPQYAAETYRASEPDLSIRAFRQDVLAHVAAHKPLIDVRSPAEYRGELLHLADYPQEGALLGGHIPGAANVPWSQAAQPSGVFRPVKELQHLYEGTVGLRPDDEVIAYCSIGERSSLTWFVLTYLLGYRHVRNYDGSWTEWGNLVGVPIEKSV
jgi:thiosulfate/3-mercaptopyruvate sulfurtransferase